MPTTTKRSPRGGKRMLAAATALAAMTMTGAAAVESHVHQFSKREFRLIGHDEVLKSYDYIIAGGGLAGLVLASRLSENANTTVLVLEAGTSGDHRKRDIDTPAGTYYASIVGSDLDWRYVTVNQPRLNNRDIYWPRGKVLGGSTAMNAMYVVRPAATELDAWAELMASDPETASHADLWNWDNMFEMMKKSENYSSPLPEPWAIGNNFAISPENHGSGGPMQLGYPGVMIDAVGNWTAACDRAGVSPLEEPNGGVTLGGFITPNYISQSNWTRSYSRSAYIDSLPPRDNLHIVTEATVTKLGFADGDRVTVGGEEDLTISNRVEFGNATAGDMATRYVVGVNKEVILSAGPMGSPKILMHSGVGPKDVLDQLGVRVHLELPGIGQHLQDHLTAGVTWQSRRETAGDLRANGGDFAESPEFLSFINNAVAFANITRLFGDAQNVLQQEARELFNNFTTMSAEEEENAPEGTITLSSLVPFGSAEVREGYKQTYNITANTFFNESAQIEMLMSLISPGSISIQSALQHPFSRGRLYINSTNPFDPIVIDPNYFSHPLDMTIMRQGVRMVRDVGGALRELGIVGDETDPGPDVQSDEDLERWLVNGAANTQYHPMGSSAMLPRKWGGVVDSKLKVYGLANVRIVDSSVFPFEFAAHLASATFGLAETASEVFKNESYTVPANAKVNDSELGPQGGGSFTADTGGAKALGVTGGVAAATAIAALGAALMLF
ncbi:mala s 12 allergen [Coprinopsis sp. MPI-PUGE-AT-0042]|nr:mala s 12 allergen [Coprinopsis sp. MPI-PUGE-AT-0042]